MVYIDYTFHLWRAGITGTPRPERLELAGIQSRQPAIWWARDRLAFARGGPERQILNAVEQRAFFPAEDGIYYIGAGAKPGTHLLQFYDFAAGRSRVLTVIDGSLNMGLTVSPDRKTVLFTVRKPINRDLMLIENFR